MSVLWWLRGCGESVILRICLFLLFSSLFLFSSLLCPLSLSSFANSEIQQQKCVPLHYYSFCVAEMLHMFSPWTSFDALSCNGGINWIPSLCHSSNCCVCSTTIRINLSMIPSQYNTISIILIHAIIPSWADMGLCTPQHSELSSCGSKLSS